MRHPFFILLFLFSCLSSLAQQPQLRHYTLSDGLPSNTVYDIFQDNKGFIWFCTSWGLSRFDGHHFETITSNNGLPDNEVFHVWQDPWHRLWVNTYNGSPTYIYKGKVYSVHNDTLCRYMEKNGIDFYDFASSPAVSGTNVKKGYVLGPNSVSRQKDPLFHSSNYQFTHEDREYFVYLKKIIRKDISGLTTVLELKDHYIRPYFYLNGHLYLIVLKDYDHKEMILYDMTFKGEEVLVKKVKMPSDVLYLTAGRNGNVWCCMTNGIVEYNPNHSKIGLKPVAMEGIVSYSCLTDMQGNSWYATNQGAYMQPANKAMVYTKANGLLSDNVYTVKYMPGGQLLVGYDNGALMVRENGVFRFFTLLGNGRWNRVRYLLPVNDHTFFAGTDMGLFKCDLPGKECFRVVASPQKAAAVKNDIMFISRSGGMRGKNMLYQMSSGTLTRLPELDMPGTATATAIDNQGIYWLGTVQGLYRYDTALQKFVPDSSIRRSRITSLEVVKSRLIIGTDSEGIFIRDGLRTIRVYKGNGLVSNICKKIYVDQQERLWVNTDKGLDRISLNNNMQYSIYHFSAADGIPSYMVNDVTFDGDKAYLATSLGIIVIDQDQASNSLPYKVYFLKASFKDSLITYPERITLNYDQNSVRITYTAISYLEEKDIRYKYLLYGSGSDTVLTEESTLTLGALKPGNYQLKVWASGKNNVWNQVPALLYITVKPPFWLENWFIGMAACLLLIMIIFIYRHRVNIIRKKEAEKSERKKTIADLEMQALRAQINPHFIFNVLNAIQNFYSKEDEISANYYMASFSDLIRKTLSHSREHWNTIDKEMSMLKTYIELEHMRFRHRFSYDIFVEPGTEHLQIPTLLLQTYAENAINHGLRHLEKEGKLQISCTGSEGHIVCIVEDNGVGFEKARTFDSRPDDYKSMGLKITAGRIAAINELYGSSIAIQINDKHKLNPAEQGTIVIITIKHTPFL